MVLGSDRGGERCRTNRSLTRRSQTLKEFIGENDRLIEVMGAFVALAIYAAGESGPFGATLSFSFMLIVTILWVELARQFRGYPETVTLMCFRGVIGASLVVFIAYFAMRFSFYMTGLMVPSALSLTAYLFSLTMRWFDSLNRRYSGELGLRLVLRFVSYIALAVVVIFGVPFGALFFAGPQVIRFLERAYEVQLEVAHTHTPTSSATLTATLTPTATATHDLHTHLRRLSLRVQRLA